MTRGDGTDAGRFGKRFTETKTSFLTSEFWVCMAAFAALLYTMYNRHDFEVWRGWTLITIAASAYIVSRGIAKAGTREPRSPRRADDDDDGYGYGDRRSRDIDLRDREQSRPMATAYQEQGGARPVTEPEYQQNR
jgi:hypothetical protein